MRRVHGRREAGKPPAAHRGVADEQDRCTRRLASRAFRQRVEDLGERPRAIDRANGVEETLARALIHGAQRDLSRSSGLIGRLSRRIGGSPFRFVLTSSRGFVGGALAIRACRSHKLVDDGLCVAREGVAEPVAQRIERLPKLFVKSHGVLDGRLGSAPTSGG